MALRPGSDRREGEMEGEEEGDFDGEEKGSRPCGRCDLPEEALLKSSRQKNFDVMGGLVWKQFRYTPKSPKILGLWLADPTGGKRKQ